MCPCRECDARPSAATCRIARSPAEQRKAARPSHIVLHLQMDALAGQFKNLTKTTLHAVKQLDPKTKRTRRQGRGYYGY